MKNKKTFAILMLVFSAVAVVAGVTAAAVVYYNTKCKKNYITICD